MVRNVDLPERGRCRHHRVADHPGLSDPVALSEGGPQHTVGGLGPGVERGPGRLRRALRAPEKQTGSKQRVGRTDGLPEGALAAVKNVICVGSGKGGVGKSTTTANLTAALFAEGKRAAALDADVWGYSIPRMLGVHGKPKVSENPSASSPLVVHGGVKAMSIEFFLEGRDQAVVWRGPMLHKAIRQFLEDVEWGELDYLLIHLPPGTGDVSMTLAQLLPQSRFVIVTTPQPAAQQVAKRAAETARRFDLEIAGVIENMSGFVTPTGERYTIFGEGGGQALSDELDVPLLGKIPLQEELRVAADNGTPLVLEDPDAPASQALFMLRGASSRRPPSSSRSSRRRAGPPVPEVAGTPLPMVQ